MTTSLCLLRLSLGSFCWCVAMYSPIILIVVLLFCLLYIVLSFFFLHPVVFGLSSMLGLGLVPGARLRKQVDFKSE